MSDVLVLNRNYIPINTISWQRAFSLICKESAVALDEDLNRYNFEDWFQLSQMRQTGAWKYVNTPRYHVAVPEIILLLVCDKYVRPVVRFNRRNLYFSYGNKCCYCGKKFPTKLLTLDHVLPRSRGGKTEWDNIVLSCYPCNTRKGDGTPAEAKMQMHYQPFKPERSFMFYHLRDKLTLKNSWQRFIDAAYWQTELKND
jgi:5-methylcytosine-specific restriction endonuclease McrA